MQFLRAVLKQNTLFIHFLPYQNWERIYSSVLWMTHIKLLHRSLLNKNVLFLLGLHVRTVISYSLLLTPTKLWASRQYWEVGMVEARECELMRGNASTERQLEVLRGNVKCYEVIWSSGRQCDELRGIVKCRGVVWFASGYGELLSGNVNC